MFHRSEIIICICAVLLSGLLTVAPDLNAQATEPDPPTPWAANPAAKSNAAANGFDYFQFFRELFWLSVPPTEPSGVPRAEYNLTSTAAAARPAPSNPTVPSYTWSQFEQFIGSLFAKPATGVGAARRLDEPPSTPPAPDGKNFKLTQTVPRLESMMASRAQPPQPKSGMEPATAERRPKSSTNGIGDLSQRLVSVSTVSGNATAGVERRPQTIGQLALQSGVLAKRRLPPKSSLRPAQATKPDISQLRRFFAGLLRVDEPPTTTLFDRQPAKSAPPPPDLSKPMLKIASTVLPLLAVEALDISPTKTASLAKPGTSAVPQELTIGKWLSGVDLTIGVNGKLGGSATIAVDTNPNCLQKGPRGHWFCFDHNIWPDEIADKVEVDTWLYRNGRRIVQFVEGRATRIFTVFPARNFKAVSAYFQQLFGLPTERSIARLALIGAPTIANPSHRWRSKSSNRGQIITLELRKYDDERRMVTDQDTGFIRLYEEGTTPIFRFLNESDLMLHGIKSQP